ncbi:MAG: hypothetical protein OEX07_00530, partial [Gammaproteobacteria bacterium]|nr:hypothetical protein [Gammaproteobacteria bacterium]
MHNIASAELKNHTSSQQLNIDASLIKTLYQQANTALIGVVATATGITAIFYNEVSNQTVFAWLVTIYFLSAIRYYFIVKFKASDLSMADT